MPKVRSKRKAPARSTLPVKQQRVGRPSKKVAATGGGQLKPSRLDALPDELLLNVLGYLARPDEIPGTYRNRDILRTFRSLSLTNRHFSGLAQDFLYATVDSAFDISPYNLYKLVQTLVANPDLARRVKTIRWEENWGFRHYRPPYKPTSSETRLVRHSLKQLDVPDRSSWVEAYSTGRHEELLRMAMLHTPNLRELQMVQNPPSFQAIANTYKAGCIPLLLNAVNGRPIGMSPSYQHLRTLNLRVEGMMFRDYSCVFQLAAIKNLTLAAIDDVTSFEPDGTGPEPSGVTHLSVLESFVDGANLIHLIRRCRELQSFKSSFDGNDVLPVSAAGSMPQPAHFVWPDIRSALFRHRNTLTNIDLDDRSEEQDSTRDPLPIGSFKEFSKLASIGVPYHVLFDKDDDETDLPDLLPDSLQSLSLTVFEDEQDTHDCYERIVDYLIPIEPLLPKLNHINIRAHKIDHLGHLRCRDLWDHCRPSDIRLTVERDDELYESFDFDGSEFDSESDYDDYDDYDSDSHWDHPMYDGFGEDDDMEDEMMDYLYEEIMGAHHHMHFGAHFDPFLHAPLPPLAFGPSYPFDLDSGEDDDD